MLSGVMIMSDTTARLFLHLGYSKTENEQAPDYYQGATTLLVELLASYYGELHRQKALQ